MRRAYGRDASECQNFVIQAFIRNFAVNFKFKCSQRVGAHAENRQDFWPTV